MSAWLGERTIKYEAELDKKFGREMLEKHALESIHNCIQCGTCSGTCPVSPYMDYTPRRIIAMTRAGFKQEVLNSFTMWLCASCYSCTVDCPKEIKITELMYWLKQQAIKEKTYPRRFLTPALAKSFYSIVKKFGRNNEGLLIFMMYMRTNPFKMIKQSKLGLKLLSKGRLGLGIEQIKRKEELKPLLELVEKVD
ncbi:MAG: 4Fe-4S dicluster domain-containing protein [bacterium]|jgi:heterodisulfide reductase subunit C|nr:4Fe-4S dicluster domain-containing protein [bacterium]